MRTSYIHWSHDSHAGHEEALGLNSVKGIKINAWKSLSSQISSLVCTSPRLCGYHIFGELMLALDVWYRLLQFGLRPYFQIQKDGMVDELGGKEMEYDSLRTWISGRVESMECGSCTACSSFRLAHHLSTLALDLPNRSERRGDVFLRGDIG